MKVAALLTAMDVPLGRAVGNAVEVAEAVETLEGNGPDDLVAVTVALAEVMLELANLPGDPRRALQDGSALAVWRAMVRAQGGDPDAPLPRAGVVEPVLAERDGFLGRLEARSVGVAAWRLGAGRARKEDPVLASAGVPLPGQARGAGNEGPDAPRTSHRRPSPPGTRSGGAARRDRNHDGGNLAARLSRS